MQIGRERSGKIKHLKDIKIFKCSLSMNKIKFLKELTYCHSLPWFCHIQFCHHKISKEPELKENH